MTDHGFCSMHHIAYNRRLDPICPQCTLARIQPGNQLDYDSVIGKPLDPATGKPLDPFTLQPVA